MSRLGTIIRKELRRMAAAELRAQTGELRSEVNRLKRIVADHDRMLGGAGLTGLGKRRGRRLDPLRIRKRLGLSQDRMAALLGVHRNTVVRLESKKGGPKRAYTADALSRISRMTPAQAQTAALTAKKPRS